MRWICWVMCLIALICCVASARAQCPPGCPCYAGGFGGGYYQPMSYSYSATPQYYGGCTGASYGYAPYGGFGYQSYAAPPAVIGYPLGELVNVFAGSYGGCPNGQCGMGGPAYYGGSPYFGGHGVQRLRYRW